MTSLRALGLFLMLALGACCGWAASQSPEEAAETPLTFSHQLHVDDFGMECGECHAVAEAEEGAQSLLPQEAVCLDCHDREAECDWCHGDGLAASPMPPASRLHFALGPPRRMVRFDAEAEARSEDPLERSHTEVWP